MEEAEVALLRATETERRAAEELKQLQAASCVAKEAERFAVLSQRQDAAKSARIAHPDDDAARRRLEAHLALRSRCLFATHYHELARLAETCEALSLHHVRAREWKGDLVLLHELAEGPADKSYGLAVARLAGVPAPVVKRAKAVLDKLEKGRPATGGLAAGLDDLPLFAAAIEAAEEKVDALREKLGAIDIDALSPRAALDLLYDLKREL